jgi:hypothetical protein
MAVVSIFFSRFHPPASCFLLIHFVLAPLIEDKIHMTSLGGWQGGWSRKP